MNDHLKDHHILILGLGLSGLAMARWCARLGAEVTVADTRAAPPQLETLRAEMPAVRFVAGPLDAKLIADADRGFNAIYRSPGLSPDEVSGVTSAARERGLCVEGELSLFVHALEQLKTERDYAPSVLAITGTNGKTTVTSLTGQLVERAGKSVVVAGNIGPSMLDMLGQALDQDALPEVWVLELSSFQLDAVTRFEPAASTILNLTQDHLDWHGDMAAYAAAKAKVFGDSGVMILNRDDPLVAALRPPVAKGKAAKLPQRPVLTFGAGLPEAPEDFGIEMVNGMAWLVRALEADETLRRRKDAAQEIHLQRLMPVDALRIRGRHNAVNALSALALAVSCGCQLAPMLYGLREYRGEPHRVESIGLLGDVEYFDDSKGTNVGATVAALNGLGADRRLIVILGGEGKGQDFSPLLEPVKRFVRAAILIGRDADKIRAALEGSGAPLINASDMTEAVALARDNAEAGDAVLLSPACASFDMYRNYAHRADAFCAAVRDLAHAEGLELEVPA
ncbi:UDP-N-acetylmuramoyl-L-alanine--D-glutamate ligase [Ottowia thiooxydans]|uniref:UDP-N-acetylmuramoylalanine--D-glutamate ligase n=1 Tax=Ottowia thiooxydans TaxID=219182 RepID=A0ABV2QEV7_9BURK